MDEREPVCTRLYVDYVEYMIGCLFCSDGFEASFSFKQIARANRFLFRLPLGPKNSENDNEITIRFCFRHTVRNGLMNLSESTVLHHFGACGSC